ncbi:MAG: GNAT family N-acetyltransferase [Bacilli bacterium]|nr:GNAT family N-acetyltransferase [Bacilli bacterium]
MIKEINDKYVIKNILSKNFPNYVLSNDPFERVYAYGADEIYGLISISVIYERAEVNYIVVKEEQRNMGIGSELLQYVIDVLLKENVLSVSLEVGVSNLPAILLYKKFGFIKKSIRKNYYGGKDAYLMIKDLR